MLTDITAKSMYDDILMAIAGKERCYLLLDEVQEIEGWERAVNSLLENADVDIYAIGSNSKLMSSEISTYLTGRYVTIPVYTLSSKEYLAFKAGRRSLKMNCFRSIFVLVVFQLLLMLGLMSSLLIRLLMVYITQLFPEISSNAIV